MEKKLESQSEWIDLGRYESPKLEPPPEIKEEFGEAARLGNAGKRIMENRLRDHPESSPELAGGDEDAAWQESDIGDELVGGSNPTPGQDVVEELGAAAGLSYEDNESLRPTDKVRDRDAHRWELDPASSEDYQDRSRKR